MQSNQTFEFIFDNLPAKAVFIKDKLTFIEYDGLILPTGKCAVNLRLAAVAASGKLK